MSGSQEVNMQSKIAHLEMIQAVVGRMAKNSSDLKSWTVVLLAGLFGVSGASGDTGLVLIGYFPTGVFWALDSYYLRQERLFRKLHDSVRKRTDEADFSMDTSSFNNEVDSGLKTLFSISVFPFYGVTLLVILGALFSLFALS